MEKVITKEFELQLVGEEEDEAFAAVAKNKTFNYLKFILTDDLPNANKQKIPQDEFENLIQSGFFTPLKMAFKQVKDGHDESFPLGVITHLKQDSNQIRGIAALWSRERPEDVQLVKESYAKKIPLNVSWEIMYSDSEVDEEGIEILKGTSLRAATIVGLPAYEGRTPIYAVASKETEDLHKMEVEQLQAELTEIKTKYDEAQTKIKNLEEQQAELLVLREFKAAVDAKEQKEQKLAAIKTKFVDAGITKEDEYFATNQDLLLNLSDEALDFMIQELVSFAEKLPANSSKKTEIPEIKAEPQPGDNIPELVNELKKRLQK